MRLIDGWCRVEYQPAGKVNEHHRAKADLSRSVNVESGIYVCRATISTWAHIEYAIYLFRVYKFQLPVARRREAACNRYVRLLSIVLVWISEQNIYIYIYIYQIKQITQNT